mmetsp:Transcript_10056/g.16940  ORF Transcript_10056/g.16940 Transcript_10056/m.16940 type:complete len:109 (-) Transcript_10056:1429-1755(-)
MLERSKRLNQLLKQGSPLDSQRLETESMEEPPKDNPPTRVKEKDRGKRAKGELVQEGQASSYYGYFGQQIQNIDKMMSQRQIPGFSVLKERVLKPLMVATERVVDYYY